MAELLRELFDVHLSAVRAKYTARRPNCRCGDPEPCDHVLQDALQRLALAVGQELEALCIILVGQRREAGTSAAPVLESASV